MKTCHAIKHAERHYLGKDVVIVGGGIPTRGIVVGISANHGRIFLSVKFMLNKQLLTCTFPVEAIVMKEDWMFQAARLNLQAYYDMYNWQSYDQFYRNIATAHGYDPNMLYSILKAFRLL